LRQALAQLKTEDMKWI